ncbi:MAG: hypothetical protein ABIK36_07395 [Pseudomonadota bacterium]
MPKLLYEAVRDLDTLQTYADLRSGDHDLVSRAILTISWHDEWTFAQAICLEFACHEEYWIRKNSITGLGHIARIHRAIDIGSVLDLFGRLTKAGVPAYEFDDMFGEILVFVVRQGRRNV